MSRFNVLPIGSSKLATPGSGEKRSRAELGGRRDPLLLRTVPSSTILARGANFISRNAIIRKGGILLLLLSERVTRHHYVKWHINMGGRVGIPI